MALLDDALAKSASEASDDRELKILHVVNKWKQGGIERFIEGLLLGCDDQNIHQSILSICTEVASSIDCPKFGPMHSSESLTSMLYGAKALDKFLVSRAFDVVHIYTQNPSALLYARIAMAASYLILADSGEIQEETPSLGKSVLAMRDTTERPEVIDTRALKLVGASENAIFDAFTELLDEPLAYSVMSHASNPHGDDYASKVISDILVSKS